MYGGNALHKKQSWTKSLSIWSSKISLKQQKIITCMYSINKISMLFTASKSSMGHFNLYLLYIYI
jgi:hypothetical protein